MEKRPSSSRTVKARRPMDNWRIEGARSRTPTDDEIADQWSKEHPSTIYALGKFRRYRRGFWPAITRRQVENELLDVMKKAKPQGVRPTYSRLNSVVHIASVPLTREGHEMDTDSNILVLKNGTLELEPRQLREHRRGDYALSALPFDYDPLAIPVNFLRAIGRLQPQDARFFQKYLGLCLTKETKHERASWLLGPAGCGKSALIAGVQAMTGEMGVQLSLSDIERSRFSLPRIVGKRVIYATEQSTSYPTKLDTVNSIVSGEEIEVEEKYEPSFLYASCAKIIWASSTFPNIPKEDGFFRRVRVIQVPPLAVEDRDIDLKERIRHEAAGILNFALTGLEMLRSDGTLEEPAPAKRGVGGLRWPAPSIEDFVKEVCEMGAGLKIQSAILFDAYMSWASALGCEPLTMKGFSRELNRLGIGRTTINGRVYRTGLQIR